MRGIKFRAWDGKEIYFPESFLNNPLEVGYFDDSGCPKGRYAHPLMQNTGLKDRNGKEIYEGDIIRYIDPWSRKEVDHIKGEVVFGQSEYSQHAMGADDVYSFHGWLIKSVHGEVAPTR